MNLLLAFATAGILGMASPPVPVQGEEVPKAKPSTLQQKRWASAKIRKDKRHMVGLVVKKILAHRDRYSYIARITGVPWYSVAALHNMESSLSFRKHLHEGSPLSGRTRWVPKGRPKTGNPPFTWEESAKDALEHDGMKTVRWKELDNSLYRMEAYNGTGYLKYHKSVPSPYLWSFTTIYSRGKYVSDGRWSSTAVSKQVGVAAIWKMLMETRSGDFPLDYKKY